MQPKIGIIYDHFPKITISCPNIQITAKNHTFIIYSKLPSAAQGTPGAPKNRYYMIISCPNVQMSAMPSAAPSTPGAS